MEEDKVRTPGRSHKTPRNPHNPFAMEKDLTQNVVGSQTQILIFVLMVYKKYFVTMYTCN